MLEEGPVKVTHTFNPNNFEPIQTTRLNEQMIGVLSLVSQGCSKKEIESILHFKKNTFKSLYRKVPSLPKPYDWSNEDEN